MKGKAWYKGGKPRGRVPVHVCISCYRSQQFDLDLWLWLCARCNHTMTHASLVVLCQVILFRDPSRQPVITNIQTFVIFFLKLLNPSNSRPGNKEKKFRISQKQEQTCFARKLKVKATSSLLAPFPLSKTKKRDFIKKWIIIIILKLNSKVGDVVQSLERLPSMQETLSPSTAIHKLNMMVCQGLWTPRL